MVLIISIIHCTLQCIPFQFLVPIAMQVAAVKVAASLEHGSRLDLPIRACSRTLVVEVDDLLILCYIIFVTRCTLKHSCNQGGICVFNGFFSIEFRDIL